MDGDELRARLRQLGLRYSKAAPLLGLSRPGLHHQMRGERPVSARTERLLLDLERHTEERNRPVTRLTADAVSGFPRMTYAPAPLPVRASRTIDRSQRTITNIDVEAAFLRRVIAELDAFIGRYRSDGIVGPEVTRVIRPMRSRLQAKLDGAEMTLLDRERKSRAGKNELKIIDPDPSRAGGEGEPDGEDVGPEKPGSADEGSDGAGG